MVSRYYDAKHTYPQELQTYHTGPSHLASPSPTASACYTMNCSGEEDPKESIHAAELWAVQAVLQPATITVLETAPGSCVPKTTSQAKAPEVQSYGWSSHVHTVSLNASKT